MGIEFINVIKTWPMEYQVGFFSFCVALFFLLVYNIVSSLMSCLKYLIGVAPSVPLDQQECPREDNLTGLCLRKGGCRTDDECRYSVNELTYRKEN